MVDRVVYILGAGFSAPLGLPVVRNFIQRAKDLFAARPKELEFYGKVFSQLHELATIKHYFASDQFDIEEVLSIFEMREQFDAKSLGDDFKAFLCSVINESMPPLPTSAASGWRSAILMDGRWSAYAKFVSSLCCARLGVATPQRGPARRYQTRVTEPDAEYDVISLNYDTVLELVARQLSSVYLSGDSAIRFRRTPAELADGFDSPLPILSKLHGCVSDQQIVPPTWRKQVDASIQAQWHAARVALARANEIRILGYSFPVSDSYVRFLLKAAASNAPNLRRIDMITLDPTGEVRKRFEDFVIFKERRFVNDDVAAYLRMLGPTAELPQESHTIGGETVMYHGYNLEPWHKEFMRAHAS